MAAGQLEGLLKDCRGSVIHDWYSATGCPTNVKVVCKPESWLPNSFECRGQSSVGVKLKDKGIGRCLPKSLVVVKITHALCSET